MCVCVCMSLCLCVCLHSITDIEHNLLINAVDYIIIDYKYLPNLSARAVCDTKRSFIGLNLEFSFS